MMDCDSSSFGSQFGQRSPPLRDLIKNILNRYPDGGQILKELIQNADDAGATKVEFLYDCRSFSSQQLPHPGLSSFQGPALYAFNDAKFSEDDWKGIQNLMKSNKKDDPLKVGRFGIGFNSVYHITDLPGIVSGDCIGFLDPHEKYFGRGESGRQYDLKEGLLRSDFPDQFLPFNGIFGCNLDNSASYEGTLFRFPLRATPSYLSEKEYTKEMVQKLFQSLREEASVILLFLKNVQSISVHERQEDDEISCLFKVEVTEETRLEIKEKRQEFLRKATGPDVTECTYIMNIQETFDSEARNFRWLVANQVGSNDERIVELADQLKLLPWVGIAVPIDAQTGSASTAGRIFCFLPLPPDVDCQTGLPVHVHGYFGVMDNRRGLVWPGNDCQNNDTAEWNELLLQKVGIRVYSKILESLVKDEPKTGLTMEQRCQLVYSVLPDSNQVKGHWKCILKPLFQELIDQKLFYCQSRSGSSWITLREGILDQLSESDLMPGTRQAILRTLVDNGLVVITELPKHVNEAVDEHFGKKCIICPSLVRRVLKSPDTRLATREDRILLLGYVLSDDPTSDLSDVPLLPLKSGEFCKFRTHRHQSNPSSSVFIPSESCPETLLPNMENRFLDPSLPEKTAKKLHGLAVTNADVQHSTQLVSLTKEIVVENLLQCLPHVWSVVSTSGHHDKVRWTPNHNDHPPEQWPEVVWRWIRDSYPKSLTSFNGVPLIPLRETTGNYLGILSEHSKFIFASDSSEMSLPSPVIDLLAACGCTVVSDPPSYLYHQDIHSYIAPPTPRGTVTVLRRVSVRAVQEHINRMSINDRNALREFLCRLPEDPPEAEKSFLLQLPLFDTLSGSATGVQVDNRMLKAASPEFSLPAGFGLVKSDQIISSADHTSRQLLALLSVEILKPAEVFLQFLFPDIKAGSVYDPEKTSEIMVWIVQQMFNFKSQCERFPKQVMALPFVRTDHEQLRKPSELYDPSDDILRDLFLGEEAKFPTEDFRDPKLVSELKELGLQTRNMVTAVELLEVAMKIDSCPLSQSSIAKTRALIQILQDKPAYLQLPVDGNATLKQKLLQLKWLPCSKDRPVNSRFPKIMPWFNGGSSFFSPPEIRSESHVLVIGSVMPILHVEMNKKLQEEFGLTSDPPLQHVVNQLEKAVRSWERQPRRKGTSEFQEMLLAIYLQLSKKPKESVSVAISDVSLGKWIWQGDGFCSPAQTALQKDFSLDLRPQLFLLPDSLRDPPSLPEFFLRHGVRQSFSKNDILGVLVDIKKKHEGSTCSSKEVESDLKLCRSVLEWVVKDEQILTQNLQEKVLVPVQSAKDVLILKPCKKCTYCDQSWLRRGGSELDIPDDYELIHQTVRGDVAQLLGVPALSTCLLSGETLGFEQTGPHEPITTRLKNILNEYKEGAGVFKELIQNADDAGARTVRFLVDWRHGPKEKLLSPKMAQCQGPALWAYNDAVFTDKDFENINKLAGATKVEDLAKIGRFGLGFNAVYHLTDVPSFVSREYLVIFDPNVNHLDNHIKDQSRPGIRINLARNPRPLTAFEDQFQPYHDIFGCNTQCRDGEKFNYDGTIFRFPFRTGREANESEISQTVYDSEKVENIVKSLNETASLLLLFTQHVNNVTLYELGKDENPKMTRKILSVKKNEAQDTLSAGISNAIPFMEQCSDWWKKRLTPNCDIKAGPSRSDLVTIDIEVFNGTEYSQKRETWLRSSSVGTGLSVGLAMGYGPVHGLLPCAGAVGKLSITPENEAVDSNRMISESVKGEAFCFLPLSIPTGFPVHINGCFAITSNRRGIWERSAGVECQPIEVQWNESLMEDALTSAYLQLLEEMKRLSEEKKLHNYSYYKLWPSYDTLQSSTWKTLVKSFYKKMVEEDLPLFQSNGNWLDIHSGYILGEILSEAPAIVETLNSLEESVFLLTPELCSSISKAGQDEVLQSRTLNLVKFFENFFFPKITSIPQNLRDPLVAFGLDCISKEQNDVVPLFRENACIPCSEDGSQLAKPCNLISPEGEAACLYSEEDGRLPVGEDFLERKRLHVLEELGMVKDQLPWSEICERAKSVKKLAAVSYEGALERARNLINYLNRDIAKRPDEESDHQTILQSTNFLPFITIPPPEYGLPWKGCDEHGQALFRSPKDLFMATDVDLVGSCFLIVDESRDKGCGHMNAEVKQLLGFPERRPNNSQVLQQLNAIINTWSEMSENDRKAKKSVVERTCKSIYKYFNDFLVSAVAEQEGVQNEAVEYIKTELASIPWLFIQGSFVSTEKVARKWIGNGAPFLYGLPDGFADNYENLMLLVEVKGSFDASDFVTALHQLRVSKENAALDDNELKIAICFLQELKDVQQDLLEKSSNRLFLPDNNKVLRLASELTISNTPWLLQVASSAQYVHKDITNDLAFKFGAKWLKDRILDPYSKSIVTPFGQHEKLTDRLKTILKDYPCDAGILKELVQNADDAQATEIHFIYDTRNLPCERVFQEHAEEVQGPALCVYNNRPFSDKDLEGIQKIGIGSKNEDPEKTGQFGIGFNAVYHLTDCPSFLSNNETLCVFDPHCRYARGATPEYPGRQFGPIDDKFREGFSHSLSGYNINEQLNLKGSTMFRLPLRTVQRSRHSLISKKFFSEDKMRDLISKFKSEAKKMLLFLNHMKKISISEIDKNGKLRQQYVVSSIMDAEDEEKRRNMTALAKKCKDTPTDKIPWQGVTYPMILSDSNGITEEWLVHQCFGVKRNGPEVEIPDGKKYGLLPRGGVAALVSRLPKRERGWIPNEPRHVAYCFLPLPVFTPLPVHVNGHFALNSSRRALWVDTDSIGPLTKWNNFVKSCVLAPGYAALILEARKYMPHSEREPTDKAQCYFPSDITADLGLGWYHKLFPNISESTDEWKTLADHVYGFLGKTEAPVLPVVVADEPNGDEDGKKLPRRIRKWISAQEGLFVERLLPNESLWKVLLQIHLPMLVKSPSRICSAFTEAGVPSRFLSPQSVIDDLRTFRSNGSVCQLGDVPSKLEDTTIRSIAALKELISYCSKVEKRFTGLLNGLPLLLTADGQLRVFEVGHPVYCSKFSDLFPKRNDSFVHPELVRDLRSIMINDKTKTATNDTNTNEQDQPVPRVLQDLTVNAIAQFMSDVFPSTARATSNHLPFPDDDLPTKEWLMRLWVFLQNHAELEQPETKVPLQALGKWPIIPTMCGKLVTVDNAKTVFDLTASERESSRQEKVRECLKKLKCPSLDKEITFEKLNKRTSSIRPSHRKKPVTDPHVSHPHSAADILRVFKYMNEAKLLDVSELCEEDVREILLYFQDDYENLKPKEHFNKILKDLPMYKAMNNNHYSLSSFSSYVVVPVGVPVSGIHVLQRSTNCLFLHYDAALSLKKLYQELGAGTERSVPQFYIEYILPNFHLLSPESQKEYLLHLRDDILHSSYAVQDEKDLVDVLKNTCCIPTREGQLRRARDLYDPRNTVFKVMLDEDDSRFPSSPFNGSEWLEFLEVIGLKTEVEATEFLIFCNRVASLANQSPESEVNIKRSKELVKYLLTKDHLREPRFLASLSTVKFIASERVGSVLLSLHKQCHCRDQNQQPPFLQFSNSVPWRYKKLVWSSAPLLPEWVQPTTDLDLGIQNPPSVDSVVSHLQNISTSLAEHSKKEEALPQPQVVKKIMTGIYEFLRKKIQCCGKEISQNCCPDCESIGYRLRTTACILVEDEKVLVRGDQLSFNDPKKSLQPFLYVVPREYGNYEHLLKRLGATEKFTSLQLACVFKEIKNRCKDVHMNPDLEKKARNAMHLFFKCIMEESSGGNGKSTTSKLTELYLPSEDKHMVKSNIMVYRVPARHAPTVTKLEYHVLLSLEKCELPRAQENEYIQSLAEHLRPTPFDKVVKERLDPLCLKNDCQLCKDNTLCDFIEKHISIMKSRGFHEGLVRLMKHQKNDSHLTEEEKEKLSRLASIKVEIKCMVSIKIHLILAGTHQPLENSSAPRQSYVVKNEESWTLYIQHQTGMKSRQSYLSKSVNKILEWLLNNESLLVVADMLSCESPSQITAVLDDHDIPRDVSEDGLMLGREVPFVFHYLMQQNPLFIFHRGELVAFEVKVPDRNDGENEALEDLPEEDEFVSVKYVLAEVIDCVSPQRAGEAYDFEARYLIDLGKEKKEVSVLDLYKFLQNDPDEVLTREMVLFAGDASVRPTNMDDAKREIREALRAAWRLPPDMRRKVIKRLYLRWHPDKNPNNREFATEMMAFLLSEIKRMKEEERRIVESPVDHDFDDLFRTCDNRAQRERETYRNYRTVFGGSPGGREFSSECDYTVPRVSEARRWLEQSRRDLEAADFLLSACKPFDALACFLSHQIVEKSLKAALYAKCGLTNDQLHTHDVYALACKVGGLTGAPPSVTELAAKVSGYYLTTRYPNRQPHSIVPADAFSNDQSKNAVESARKLFQLIKGFTGITRI